MYTLFKYHLLPAFLGHHDGRGLPSVNIDKTISFKVTLLIMFVIQYVESVYYVSKFMPEISIDAIALIINFIALSLNLMIQVWLGKALAKEKEVLLYHFFFISIIIEVFLIGGYYLGYVIPKAFLISWVLVAMYSNYKAVTNRMNDKDFKKDDRKEDPIEKMGEEALKDKGENNE